MISAADFDAARDRILLGRREGSNVLLPEEKHAVAVHEAGHALVAALSEHADPVAKVTILPAGQALGVTEQLPLVDATSTARTTSTTRSPSASAAGPPRSWSWARVPPARPTTWPAPPTWPPRWSGSSGCRGSSARWATPRADRCSWAEAGRLVQPALRRGDPGDHRFEVSRLLRDAEARAVELLRTTGGRTRRAGQPAAGGRDGGRADVYRLAGQAGPHAHRHAGDAADHGGARAGAAAGGRLRRRLPRRTPATDAAAAPHAAVTVRTPTDLFGPNGPWYLPRAGTTARWLIPAGPRRALV